MRFHRAVPGVRPESPAAFAGLAGLTLLLLAALALLPRWALAQDGGDGYLFRAPSTTITIRTGYDAAMASSDLWSYVTRDFTVKKSDFGSAMLAGDIGFRLSPTVDAVIGLGYSRSVAQSAYRDWQDNNNLPIQQATEFTRMPLTASLKWYLEPRGRAVGHFAWIPAKFSPYVGGGAGTMWYKFRQAGDFIDFNTTVVSYDVLQSSAWTPTAQLFTGADFTINPGMALTTEARYSWARGPLSSDFVGFNRIDLSGVSITAGLTFRF